MIPSAYKSCTAWMRMHACWWCPRGSSLRKVHQCYYHYIVLHTSPQVNDAPFGPAPVCPTIASTCTALSTFSSAPGLKYNCEPFSEDDPTSNCCVRSCAYGSDEATSAACATYSDRKAEVCMWRWKILTYNIPTSWVQSNLSCSFNDVVTLMSVYLRYMMSMRYHDAHCDIH